MNPHRHSARSMRLARAVFALLAMACCLAACQPTPSEKPVKNKKQDSFLNALSTASPGGVTDAPSGGTASPATGATAAPVRWTEPIPVKPHPATVFIDADVAIPAAAALPVYLVEPKRMTQAQIDGFLSLFGGVQYHLNTDIRTKDDYQAEILRLQAELAKVPGNEEYTDTQKKQSIKEYEEAIQWNRQIMLSAPDSVDDGIAPAFTNQYIIARDSQPERAVDEDGNPMTPPPGGKTAKQEYESTHTEAINVRWESGGLRMTLDAVRSDRLSNNSFQFRAEKGALPAKLSAEEAFALVSSGANVVANIADLKGLSTTYAEAKALAENAVAKLGLDYMTVALSAKEMEYKDLRGKCNRKDASFFTDFSKLEYTDRGYVFYFMRNLGGVNETYCSNIVMMNQYDEPWPYERLCAVVDDSGIRELRWDGCGSKLGEKLAAEAKLMPFDEIQKIAVRQFTDGNIRINDAMDEDSSTFFYKHLLKMDIHINRVTLGYARVKLSDGSGRYALAPAWDFFGYDAYTMKPEEGQAVYNEYSMEKDIPESYAMSYLTVNAIDGTVIDRSLGY